MTAQRGVAQVADGHPVGADLRYEGGAHTRRGRADTISKVTDRETPGRMVFTLVLR